MIRQSPGPRDLNTAARLYYAPGDANPRERPHVPLLDKYIVKAILVPTAAAFVVVSFLVIANELKEQSERLIVQVLTAIDVVKLGAAFLPSLLPLILPITLFFGVLMGYGRLAERGEITAMRASGVAFYRLVAPAIVLGIAITLLTLLLQDRLQPRTMGYALNFFRNELPRRATVDRLSPGMMHTFGEYRVYFAGHGNGPTELRDVTVVRDEGGGRVTVFRAESGEVTQDEAGSSLLLRNCHSVAPKGYRGTLDVWTIHLPYAMARVNVPRSRIESTLVQLLDDERRLSHNTAESPTFSGEKELRETRHEIADRLSKPFAALLLACVGAPLAVESTRYRRGGRQRLLAAGLVPLVLYYLLHVVLNPNTLWSMRTNILMAWLPNVALLGLAIALMVRARRVH